MGVNPVEVRVLSAAQKGNAQQVHYLNKFWVLFFKFPVNLVIDEKHESV